MSERTWYGFDFGAAAIRVSRARATTDPAHVAAELLQFQGRPALPNAAVLAPDGETLQEVGAEAAALDPAALDDDLVHYAGASPDNDPESEGGHVARLLLAYLVAALRRDQVPPPGDPGAEALIAVPIATRQAEQTRRALEDALCAAGFARATAGASALAALAHYTAGQPSPGRYLVVDGGYTRTRFALVECRPDTPPRVVAEGLDRPGGRDFDDALLRHFAATLHWSGAETARRRALIVDFKHRLSTAWAEGQSGRTSQESVDGQSLTLSLDVAQFISAAVAGPHIEEFRHAADGFVYQHAPDGDLSGIVLAGGGANWPFVRNWAGQRVGADKVLTDSFPEQAVVRGLPRLAAPAEVAPAPPSSDRPPAEAGRRSRPPEPAQPTPARPLLSPGLAAVVEWLFGVVGFLGLGWFLGAKKVAIGFVLLFSWWLVLLLLLVFGVATALSDRPATALALLPFWVGVPFASGLLVYRAARRAADGR